MSSLGCAQGYDVLVISAGGVTPGITLGALSPSSVAWGRRIDDISEATIVVPFCAFDSCGILADIHVWHYEIQVFRDGKYVWSGPIVQVTGTRTEVTVVANDVFALIRQRFVQQAICFSLACTGPEGTGAPADLTVIGTAIINDALLVDGHNYVIDGVATGILGERLYQPGENSWTVLQEALQLGLDATVLGRKIVLGKSDGTAPFGRTATLTCDDFAGDLEVVEDGFGLATKVIVLGSGFVGVAKAAGTDVNGTDPYYGLIEYESPSRPELNTQALVDAAAAAILASRYPAPVTLLVPSGSTLSPNAPIDINELVPGTITTVIADCLCRPITADLVLTAVDVTFDSTGEKVGVTYGSLGSINSGLNPGT